MTAEQITKALVVNDRGEVLLLRRSKTAPRRALQWDLPGGIMDEGDASYAAACVRELAEETGIRVTLSALTLVRAESAMATDDSGMALTWLYFVVHMPKNTDVTLSFEHDKFQWLNLDEAIKASEYDRQARTLQYLKDNRLLEQ